MSSHAQDQKTQTAASAGAQQQDAQLAANAAQNQQFANQSRSTLFGTYNPETNQYSGGTESAFLNPSSLNSSTLTGPYATAYNTEANTTAQGAKNAVATSTQDMANRGMGKSPAGFGANQEREAYQTQAGQNANNYSGLFGAQHNEALTNYQNANNMLNSNATGTANLSLAGNQAAAGNYAGLYGTASQQKQNPWAATAGALAGLGGAASGFMPK